VPRTWNDSLVRPKHWKKDMREEGMHFVKFLTSTYVHYYALSLNTQVNL